jgi:hypothetical protein
MWDWYSRPGDWRTRGGRRTGLLISISLAALVGAIMFGAAIELSASMGAPLR